MRLTWAYARDFAAGFRASIEFPVAALFQKACFERIPEPASGSVAPRRSPGALALAATAGDIRDMSLPPDDEMPPAKPKLSPEERRRRDADRLKSLRLRMAISRELDERGITTPNEIGAALGMPPAEATKLLTRHQWREGDVTQLAAAAARLGVLVPKPSSDSWPS
jgi:hypothetical protein